MRRQTGADSSSFSSGSKSDSKGPFNSDHRSFLSEADADIAAGSVDAEVGSHLVSSDCLPTMGYSNANNAPRGIEISITEEIHPVQGSFQRQTIGVNRVPSAVRTNHGQRRQE